MVEKTAVSGQLLPQKAQGSEDALQHSCSRDEASLFADAESGKTEPGCGNAGRTSLNIVLNVTAVLYHAGVGAALFPEKKETRVLQLVQELILFRR